VLRKDCEINAQYRGQAQRPLLTYEVFSRLLRLPQLANQFRRRDDLAGVPSGVLCRVKQQS